MEDADEVDKRAELNVRERERDGAVIWLRFRRLFEASPIEKTMLPFPWIY